MRESEFMDVVHVPGTDTRTDGRVVHPYAANLAYHSLSVEIASEPDWDRKLARAQGELAPLYSQNHVAAASPDVQWVPLAFYQDGISFAWDRNDGALGSWLENLVTHRRHLVVVTRKMNKCQCGCRGWCSLYVVYRYLVWLLWVMREGSYPEERYDKSGWRSHAAAGLAGMDLGFRALCLIIKGDWMEFASSMGFSNWKSNISPCYLCWSK